VKKRDWTDAKFEVVKPPQAARRAPWFDWRNFLIVGAMSLVPIIRGFLERHH
jgi:hypothetical protein